MASSTAADSAGSGLRSSTAKAMGTSTTAVAELEIHMLTSAAAKRKPSTKRFGVVPPERCSSSRARPKARRRWAPHRSMAVDNTKLASKSRISVCP